MTDPAASTRRQWSYRSTSPEGNVIVGLTMPEADVRKHVADLQARNEGNGYVYDVVHCDSTDWFTDDEPDLRAVLAENERLRSYVTALSQTIHAIPDEITNGAANLAHARADRDRLRERVREFEAARQRALAALIASRDQRGELYLDLTCRLCDRGAQWRDAWSTADDVLLQAIAPDTDDTKGE